MSFGISSSSLFAQDSKSSNVETLSPKISRDGRTFRGVSLLTQYDQALSILKKDSLILVKPESDFQNFDEDPPTWIVASLPPLMNHIYYHFFDHKLYIISLFFNPKRTSYGELYQILKKNYGMPTSMDADQTKWELPNNTLVVLTPAPSLKYLDKTLFQKMKTEEGAPALLSSLEKQEYDLEQKILADL